MEASALPASVGLGRTRIAIGGPLLRIRSDEQLVTLFREGNDEAFRVIHDRYRARLFAYTRQMLGRTVQDPEDAVQEIFMRAYYGLRASDRRLALKPWLYRIAHNRCVDDLRRPLAIAIEGVETLVPCIQDPAVRVEQREVLRRLISDVQRLPEQQRSALLMRELSGMAYADVSGALGVSVPAVKSLLVRARIGLAQAGEARNTTCAEIRENVILSIDRGVRTSGLARRHMRDCKSCREFRSEVRGVSRQLAALAPTLGPIGVIANLLGWGGGGGGAAAGSGAVAGGGATAAGGAAGGGAAASAGVLVSGAGHVVTLLAAAVVTAGGAVELQTSLSARAHVRVHHHHAAAFAGPGPATRSAGDGAVITTSGLDSSSESSAAPSSTAAASGSTASTRGTEPAAASRKASSHASSTSTVPISETLDPDNMIYSTGGASTAPDSTQGAATGTGTSNSAGAATGTGTANTTATGTDNAGATTTGTGSGTASGGTSGAGSGTGTGTGSDTGAGTGSATGAGTGTDGQSSDGDTTASGSGGAAGTAPQ